VFKACVATSYD